MQEWFLVRKLIKTIFKAMQGGERNASPGQEQT